MGRPNESNRSIYEACVLDVATGTSIAAFCRRTKTARSTVSRWQEDPQFTRDVDRLRRELLDQAVGKFSGAVTTIADGMINLAIEAASEAVKLAAQRSVIENLMAVTEFAELKARLEAIERRIEEGDARGHAHRQDDLGVA